MYISYILSLKNISLIINDFINFSMIKNQDEKDAHKPFSDETVSVNVTAVKPAWRRVGRVVALLIV